MPTSYPTSCLLGYVDLSDCMSSEDYKEEVSKALFQQAFLKQNKHFLLCFMSI